MLKKVSSLVPVAMIAMTATASFVFAQSPSNTTRMRYQESWPNANEAFRCRIVCSKDNEKGTKSNEIVFGVGADLQIQGKAAVGPAACFGRILLNGQSWGGYNDIPNYRIAVAKPGESWSYSNEVTASGYLFKSVEGSDNYKGFVECQMQKKRGPNVWLSGIVAGTSSVVRPDAIETHSTPKSLPTNVRKKSETIDEDSKDGAVTK